jgi:hypothetical protein
LACRLADEAELSVSGLGPDGRGVEADSDAAVVDQDPAAGHKVHRGSRLVLRTGGPGGSAGDREPLRPPPAEHRGDRDIVDPDADPELAGAPA